MALLSVAAVASAAAAREGQVVVRAGSIASRSAPVANFTGEVRLRPLTTPTPPGQAGAALVTFAAGARSNWHTHPAGQTLFVTDGCGWTQAESGPTSRICKGDTVYVPPGVKHWHGATATSTMTHFTVSETHGGENVEWMEPVTAAQYHGPTH
jgi:quercetin dioxygenase-like cupin family protein